MKREFLLGIACLLFVLAAPETVAEAQDEPAAAATDESGSRTLRRSNRMDFDARLVRGETAGTGAVVLFSRGNRRLPNLLERRRGFLRPTVEEVMGTQGRAGGVAAAEPAREEDPSATEETRERANRRARPNRREAASRPARRGSSRRATERAPDAEAPARRGGRSRDRR